MALIQCPECRTEVSDQAISCPRCGFPVASRKSAVSDGVREMLTAGNKIGAIKVYREATHLGLKESKDAVELIENEMRRSGALPPSIPSSSLSGFIALLLAFLLLIAGIVLWMMRH